MSKFMLLIRNEGDPMAHLSEAERAEHMQDWGTYMGGLGSKLVDGLPLAANGHVHSGTTVGNGRHEINGINVGGYLIVEADSLEAADALAAGCPALQNPASTVEVRECLPM